MSKKTRLILQIAATYIGTVVGAGFASGQSIMQFFTIYGAIGGVGIFIATLLFMWIGTKMMILSHRIKANSYQELNNYLFGSFFGKVANVLTFIILFGVTSVMISGAGSIFEEQLGLPYQLGIIISILLCFLVMTKEMNGILIVNSLVVPMMLIFLIIIATKVVGFENILHTTDLQRGHLQDFKWLISPFAYAALNFAFIQAVMVPLGNEVKDENVLKWGGIWGGIGLGFMLLISHFAINSRMPEIVQFDIPMAEIIRSFGMPMHILFLIVIYGEIFTTLVGNVFGITRQIQSLYTFPKLGVALFILLSCFLISQVGFSSLLYYLYPIFGYLGMILLFFLVIKKYPKKII
ncbi:putative membrane protein YkvI [Paenibacillus anaericanus]|uniref:Transporter n=1 Tax=Paenibacillus anaericanus TaxID=170367 RepID=A0A3S1C143_9BACL|nr:hypothetical protein [Paenibacillus anaericanus]MDQ0090508.1 putative membrane protein YkvI [Paenibacillus anaericanus]RUT39736.1 hypothetical protein EJP82_25580 [Paenibacillus anaericanus]